MFNPDMNDCPPPEEVWFSLLLRLSLSPGPDHTIGTVDLSRYSLCMHLPLSSWHCTELRHFGFGKGGTRFSPGNWKHIKDTGCTLCSTPAENLFKLWCWYELNIREPTYCTSINKIRLLLVRVWSKVVTLTWHLQHWLTYRITTACCLDRIMIFH